MLNLIKNHKELFILCFSCMFFSGLGQTFFISQYIPFIREDLALSRSEVSLYYSVATFIASFNLPFLGMMLDRFSITRYFLITTALLSLGLITLALGTNIFWLCIGFYLFRGFGQVPLSLLSITITSKYFGKHRGKFLTISGLGKPLGEGVIPVLAILLISTLGWRYSFMAFCALMIIILYPIAFKIIPKIPTSPLYAENEEAKVKKEVDEHEIWNWKKVFQKKWPFFIMLTNALIPFILTGLFFQQDAIATFKSWELQTMSYSFMAFSAVHILGNLYWGPLIDRIGAINILPIVMLPLILGLLGLLIFDHKIMAYIYMGLNGLSVGSNALSKNALWAEIYGTKSLGSIKGMDTNIIVIGTSAAPIIYGALLDFGMSTQDLLWALIALSVIGLFNYILIFLKFRMKKSSI